jgi:hypothetical protein
MINRIKTNDATHFSRSSRFDHLSTLRHPGQKARACSGLTLSGASLPRTVKGAAWRRRTGQNSNAGHALVLPNFRVVIFYHPDILN